MDEEKALELYNFFNKEGYDLGDIDNFKSALSDEVKGKELHTFFNAEGYDVGDIKNFNLKKKDDGELTSTRQESDLPIQEETTKFPLVTEEKVGEIKLSDKELGKEVNGEDGIPEQTRREQEAKEYFTNLREESINEPVAETYNKYKKLGVLEEDIISKIKDEKGIAPQQINFIKDLPDEKRQALFEYSLNRAENLSKETMNIMALNSTLEEQYKNLTKAHLQYERIYKNAEEKGTTPNITEKFYTDWKAVIDEAESIEKNVNSNNKKIEDNSEDLSTFDDELDLFKRTYDSSKNFWGKARWAATEHTVGFEQKRSKAWLSLLMSVSAGKNIFDKEQYKKEREQYVAEWVGNEDYNKDALKYVRGQSEGLRKDLKIADINSTSDFGEWASEQIAKQLWIIAVIPATGGTTGSSIIGVGTAGTKELEMKIENETKKVKYTPTEISLASIGYGITEAGFEMLGTAVILKRGKRAYRSILKDGTKETFTKGVGKFVKGNFTATTLESTTEGFTSYFQNAIDKFGLGHKDVSLYRGMGDAMASGGFMGSAMHASPIITGNLLKPFSERKNREHVATNLEKIKIFKEQLENDNSTEIEKILNKGIAKLEEENKKILESEIAKVDSMEEGDVKELINVDEKLEQREAIKSEIDRNKEMSDEMKEDVSKENDNIISELYTRKQTILNKYKNKEGKVLSIVDTPVTLTKQGGSEVAPVKGEAYLDGKTLVIEDSEGNIYEVGNIDEIGFRDLEEMGISQDKSRVSTKGGDVTLDGEIVVATGKHTTKPNKEGKFPKNTRVEVTNKQGDKTFTLRGQTAQDMIYQLTLKEKEDGNLQSEEKKDTKEKSDNGNKEPVQQVKEKESYKGEQEIVKEKPPKKEGIVKKVKAWADKKSKEFDKAHAKAEEEYNKSEQKKIDKKKDKDNREDNIKNRTDAQKKRDTKKEENKKRKAEYNKKKKEEVEEIIEVIKETPKKERKIKESKKVKKVKKSIISKAKLSNIEKKLIEKLKGSRETVSEYIGRLIDGTAKVHVKLKDLVSKINKNIKRALLGIMIMSSVTIGGKEISSIPVINDYIEQNISDDVANVVKMEYSDILDVAPNIIDYMTGLGSYAETVSDVSNILEKATPETIEVVEAKEEVKEEHFLESGINLGKPVMTTKSGGKVRPYVIDLTHEVYIDLANSTYSPKSKNNKEHNNVYGIMGTTHVGFEDSSKMNKSKPIQITRDIETGRLEVKKTENVDNNDSVAPLSKNNMIKVSDLDITPDGKGGYNIVISKDETNGTSIIRTKDGGQFHIGLETGKYKPKTINSKGLKSHRKSRGGMVIIASEDVEVAVVVSGSPNDIFSTLNNIEKKYPNKTLYIFRGDTGAFSTSQMSTNGKVTKRDIDLYSKNNTWGHKNEFWILKKEAPKKDSNLPINALGASMLGGIGRRKKKKGETTKSGKFIIPSNVVARAKEEMNISAREGSSVEEAISDGVNIIKNSSWYKNLSTKGKKDAIRSFKNVFETPSKPKTKVVEIEGEEKPSKIRKAVLRERANALRRLKQLRDKKNKTNIRKGLAKVKALLNTSLKGKTGKGLYSGEFADILTIIKNNKLLKATYEELSDFIEKNRENELMVEAANIAFNYKMAQDESSNLQATESLVSSIVYNLETLKKTGKSEYNRIIKEDKKRRDANVLAGQIDSSVRSEENVKILNEFEALEKVKDGDELIDRAVALLEKLSFIHADDIKSVKDGLLSKEELKKELEKTKNLWAELNNDLFKNERDVSKSIFAGLAQGHRKVSNDIDTLIDTISKSESDEFLGGYFHEKVSYAISESNEENRRLTRKNTEEINSKIKDIYGKKYSILTKALNDVLGFVRSDTDKEIKTDLKDKNLDNVVLSRGKIMQLYNLHKNPQTHKHFEKAGVSEEMLDGWVDEHLTEEDIEIADWISEKFYPMLHEQINPVFEKIFFRPLPMQSHFTGRQRYEGVEDKKTEDWLTKNGFNPEAANMYFGSGIDRINHNSPIKLDIDIFESLNSYMHENNRFTSSAEAYRDAKELMNDPVIVRNIKKYNRGNIKEQIDERIETAFGFNPEKDTQKLLDAIVRAKIYSALPFTGKIGVNQLMSTSLWLARNPIQVLEGLFPEDGVSTLKEIWETSEYIRGRYAGHTVEDFIGAYKSAEYSFGEKTQAGRVAKKGVKIATKYGLMGIILGGDAGGMFLLGVPAWKAIKKEGMKKYNGDEKKAIKYTNKIWGKIAQKTQQSSQSEDRDTLQHTPLGKLLNMFGNATKQHHRNSLQATTQIVRALKGERSKGTIPQNLWKLFLNHSLQGIMYQWIQAGMLGLLSDDDEHDTKAKDIIWGALFGSFNKYFLAGDLLQAGWDYAQGRPFAEKYTPVPAFTTINKMYITQGKLDNAQEHDNDFQIEKYSKEQMKNTLDMFGVPATKGEQFIDNIRDVFSGNYEDNAEMWMKIMNYSQYGLDDKDEESRERRLERIEQDKKDTKERRSPPKRTKTKSKVIVN